MWTEVIAAIATFAIGLFIGKPIWRRFIRPAKELHDVFGAVLRAVEDGKISEEEVKEIEKEIEEFLHSLKES